MQLVEAELVALATDDESTEPVQQDNNVIFVAAEPAPVNAKYYVRIAALICVTVVIAVIILVAVIVTTHNFAAQQLSSRIFEGRTMTH